MPAHALELLLDPEDDAGLRADWEVLRAAGLPSQADHRGRTNAPHVTVVSADALGPEVRALARDLVLPLLPLRVRAQAPAPLGPPSRRGTLVLARAIEPGPALLRARTDLIRLLGPAVAQDWAPHLTLSRRLPAEQVAAAASALAHAGRDESRDIRLSVLRHWDPQEQRVDVL